jgi:hypothetical protein
VLGAQPSRAAYGELDSPSVAFPTGYPKADARRVNAVLASEKVKFAGGHWLNSHTLIKYRGDTKALSGFLEELAKCPNLTIHVSFEKPQNSASYLEGIDWAVSHMAGEPGKYHILINLASDQIDLPSLYLPDIRSGE